MKLHSLFLSIPTVLSLAALSLMACDKSSGSENKPYISTTVDPRTLTFGCEGGSASVTVTSASRPAVSSNVSWCTVTAGEYDSATYKTVLTVQAVKNETDEELSATITVNCGSSVSVSVTQDPYFIQQDPLDIEIPTAQTSPVTPVEMAALLGMGWNLGNQFDAHNNGVASETAWGNKKATQATFDKVKAAGFTTVRIPVSWMGNFGKSPVYKINSKYLDRVYEVVGYAENAGLNVILNIHHDGADSNYWLSIKDAANSETKRREILCQLFNIWTQIAEKFKDKGDFLIFEPFNEIQDGGWGWGGNLTDGGKQYAILNEWNQAFVNAVRHTGGNNATRWLCAVGYSTNPDLTIGHLVIPKGYTSSNRFLVGVHFYDPYTYTLNGDFGEWGHTASEGKKESWGDEDNVTTVFAKLKSKYVDNGYPLYLGETGCSNRSNERQKSFQKYYLEYVYKAAHDYCLTPILWDNGATTTGKESHGFFNHETGDYIGYAEEVVAVMRKAVFTTDESYTLQSVYDSAPQ